MKQKNPLESKHEKWCRVYREISCLILILAIYYRTAEAQDLYEPDNRREEAVPFIVDTLGQNHTIHAVTDEDWIYFHAIRQYPYEIKVSNLGPDLDIQIDLVSNETPFTVILNVDDEIGGEEEILTWIAPQYGRYNVRVSNAGDWPEDDSGYSLTIFKPLGLQQARSEVLSSTEICLSWASSGQENIQGFVIQRSTELTGPYQTIHEVPADVTSAVDSGLIPSTTYFYLIDEIDEMGNRGQLTAPVFAMTLSAADEMPDFDGSGQVDAEDLIELLFGLNGLDQKYDINRDGNRNYKDLIAFSRWWMWERS